MSTVNPHPLFGFKQDGKATEIYLSEFLDLEKTTRESNSKSRTSSLQIQGLQAWPNPHVKSVTAEHDKPGPIAK